MKNQYQQGSNKSQDSLNTGKQVQVGIYKFLLRNKEELFKLFCSIILGQADLLQPQLQSLGRLNPVQLAQVVRQFVAQVVDDLKKINNYKQNASEFRKERDRWVRTFEDMHAFMLSQMKHNEQTIQRLREESRQQVQQVCKVNQTLLTTVQSLQKGMHDNIVTKGNNACDELISKLQAKEQSIAQLKFELEDVYMQNLQWRERQESWQKKELVLQTENQDYQNDLKCLKIIQKRAEEKAERVLKQKQKLFGDYETLRENYNRLSRRMEELMTEYRLQVQSGKIKPETQQTCLSDHKQNTSVDMNESSKSHGCRISVDNTQTDQQDFFKVTMDCTTNTEYQVKTPQMDSTKLIEKSVVSKYLLEFVGGQGRIDSQLLALDTLLEALQIGGASIYNQWKRKYRYRSKEREQDQESIQNKFFKYLSLP